MKYQFTNNTIEVNGRTLKQIKRLSDGLIGGYIESEFNLSQDGDCFVYDNARVSENAWVYGNARVSENAWVYGNARVSGNARVYGNAWVYGYAWVYDNARVSENAWVYGNAHVSGNARVYGNAWVYGYAWVYGNAWVSGNARVSGYAHVSGNARVSGNALVSENARVYDDAEVTKKVTTTNSHRYHITITDNFIAIGCENHTIKHWLKNIDEIAAKHNYTKKELKALKLLLNALLIQRRIHDTK